MIAGVIVDGFGRIEEPITHPRKKPRSSPKKACRYTSGPLSGTRYPNVPSPAPVLPHSRPSYRFGPVLNSDAASTLLRVDRALHRY